MIEHKSLDRKYAQLITTTAEILSWNLWWRFGPDWRGRQPLIVDTLRGADADIIALQEVWDDGDENQARRIAEELGLHYVYDPSFTIDDILFGNAILTKWPIIEHAAKGLPPAPKENRAGDRRVLLARIDGPRGVIAVYCTHLAWRLEEGYVRRQQARTVCEFVEQTLRADYPPVVCGDFNAAPSSDEVRSMTGEKSSPDQVLVFNDAWAAVTDGAPGHTWDNNNPNAVGALESNKRIDYIFVGQPKDNGAGHILGATLIGTKVNNGTCPSDHYGVLAKLRY